MAKDDEIVLKEKHTGLQLIKSTFKSELELNMRLSCDYGKFIKLTELIRRQSELKDSKDLDWYSIFLIGSKTESKCSAKGNNYVIWQIYDLNNLDRQQEISLFLFGGAYKSHWKSSEFECFAILKPEFLDSNKNQQAQTPNNQSYCNPNSPFVSIGKNSGPKTDWNKFATKKVNQTLKVTLSIKSDSQLVPLGLAKDISNCQSYTKPNPNQPGSENSKKCKNLVNLEQGPFCVYHCTQLDKSKGFQANKGKYAMDKAPTNRFGTSSLFGPSQASQDLQFIPPNRDIASFSSVNKFNDLEKKAQVAKDMKAEILRSLNSSITKESTILTNAIFKTTKKSDFEVLAALDGKKLDVEEVKQIRLAEQATVKFQTSGQCDQANKEMRKLFSSKLLLPNENNITSISSQKLVDLKKANFNSLGVLGQVKGSVLPNAVRLKESVQDKKNNFNLAGMASHRDIVKEMKQQKKKTDAEAMEKPDEVEVEVQVVEEEEVVKPKDKVIASDFLRNRIEEIKKLHKIRPKLKKTRKMPRQRQLNRNQKLVNKIALIWRFLLERV